MVRFLTFKRVKGRKYRSIIFREKYRYSNKVEKEKYLSKKKSILIFGLDSSGKSKELNKLFRKKEIIFSHLKKHSVIFISCTDSIAEMVFKNIDDTDIQNYLLSLVDDKQIEAERNINKQFFKVEVLKHKAKNSFLFVDDIDKFQGKKLEILKTLVRNCKQLFATARDEKSINKTVFQIIENKKYDSINLKTTSSFDATYYVLIALMVPFAATGNYMAVIILLIINRYLDKGLGK
ncbi:MAG TPA: hypothetical protein EYP80_01555 [Candidatus Aenigmarchaeota archaeon]|nr:hypothetical protein [Candidatus Aenigmarchaeota archaeon]